MSSDVAIEVDALSKSYRLAHAQPHTGLRDLLADRLRHPFQRGPLDRFQALDGVSFDVARGEVLGVIGPNGAGKSTLLKVLARITEPDSGTAMLRGRLGSLLEVGTGFHPELTGRENVFLNGAILGMTRREIARSFDEIVDFADVHRFLDTPVKRYSSGMYVRLAFAVAAHLQAEILVVDEVLAVGDVSFQQKCLAKMSDIAGEEGRTILFISHNMAAIQSLCHRAVVLGGGRVVFDGDVDEAVGAYLAIGRGTEQVHPPGVWDHSGHDNPFDPSGALVRRIAVETSGGPTDVVRTGSDVTIRLEVRGLRKGPAADQIAVQVTSDLDVPVFNVNTSMLAPTESRGRADEETAVVKIARLPLTPGQYWLTVAVVEAHGGEPRDVLVRGARFTVIADDVYGSGYELTRRDGAVFVDAAWEYHPSEETET
jgi:lipopolysaccharide transport system ATP-binding protein